MEGAEEICWGLTFLRERSGEHFAYDGGVFMIDIDILEKLNAPAREERLANLR